MGEGLMSERLGVYIGPLEHLRGERAIIVWRHPYRKRIAKGRVFAQFNNPRYRRQREPGNLSLDHKSLAIGWHEFAEKDWALQPKSGNDWVDDPKEMTPEQAEVHCQVEEMFDPDGSLREAYDLKVQAERTDECEP